VPLRGNLHAHSLFSDGVRSAEQVIAAYEALGYDFLAITDHDDRVPPHYWRALAAVRPRLLLFRGIEIDYQPLSQHVGRIYGERDVLHVLNHPARYNLSVEETARRVAIISGDGLAIDAVEVTDTGHYRPQYDTDAIRLPKIATDDSHREPHVGRAWIEVEAPRDRDAIIHAIRAGDFRLGFAADGSPHPA
jgi:predicted metal-dependent phosphoesterase TrpH